MVRITALSVIFLSATALARPTLRRRSVCNTSPEPTITPAIATSRSSGDSGKSTVISVNDLFPISEISSGWTVAAGHGDHNVKSLKLTDDTLIVTKEAHGSKHPVVQYEGKTAILAHMPKGSLDPGEEPAGGFSFYSPGARADPNGDVPIVDLTKANEVTLTYSIYFERGFDFNLGGKLPGLYGGSDPDVAATCSGGHHDPSCFSARLMFRPKGAGELYLYIPLDVNNNDNFCGKGADDKCETSYGESVGRGTWSWTPGKWQTVVERIKLNTPGKADGEAQIYVDGKSVLDVNSITWRKNADAVIQGIQMQIFFGGHTAEWASPKDQDVHFADFSAAIIS